MLKLARILAIMLLALGAVTLSAQLSFELIIDSATTIQIEARVRIHNSNSVPYYHETSHEPFIHLGVDGPPLVGYWPIMGALQIPANSYVELGTVWFCEGEPLDPGLHQIQAYETIGGPSAMPVSNVITMPIGFNPPQPISWSLHPDAADQEGLAMRLQLTNLSSYDWHYPFMLDPFMRLSINGNLVPQSHQISTTDVYLIQNESIYFPMVYEGPLPQGSYEIQAHIHLNDWEGYIPVGDPVNIVVSDLDAEDIGAGDTLSRAPIDFYWRNSLYQCVYTEDELDGIAGYIHSLAFYSDQVLPDYDYMAEPIKVMLGTTSQTHLSDGWFDPDQMSLVYDGPLDFPMGQEQIRIELDEPFLLPINRSLVMMIERGFPLSYAHSTKPFMSQETDPLSVRFAKSDAIDFDIDSPPLPDNNQYFGYKPKLTVFYVPASVNCPESDLVPSPNLNCKLWPNPFNPSLNISFDLVQPTTVKLSVHNIRGQKIRDLVADQSLLAGSHSFVWDGTDQDGSPQGSGIYLLKLDTPQSSQIFKAVLSK